MQRGLCAVAAGQITEIEHTCADRFMDVVCGVCVGVENQRAAVDDAGLRQARTGMLHRVLLDIEGVHASGFADRAGEPFRVVTVAHREVCNDTAFADVVVQKQLVHGQ